MARQNWIEAGLLMRGQLRRELVKAGVAFTETKALGSSVFIIPDDADYRMVVLSLRRQGVL